MLPSPLRSRWRRAARLALYGALATLVGVIVLLSFFLQPVIEHPQRWGATDWASLPEVELLRDYVRLPTVSGKEALGAEFLRDRLAAAGIEATLEPIGDGSANLWAILEGESAETLVLHHHIDVSPVANPEDWQHPPFDAHIEGPWLFGRGSFDMKSYAIAQLMAFLDIAASDQPRKRSLMLLATSNEEATSRLGTQWVLSQHPELRERMWATLTEGGVVEAVNAETVKYWGIEVSQFQIMRGHACANSRERLEALREDLRAWVPRATPPLLSADLDRFLDDYGPSRSRDYTRRQLGPGRTDRILRSEIAVDRMPPFLQDLLRSDVAFKDIEEAPGGGFSVDLTILVPPGGDPAAAREALFPEWLRHGLTLQFSQPEGAAHGSSITHPAYRATLGALLNTYPEAMAGSYILPYNITDARYFRQAGVPTYGFSPFLFFTTDSVRADGVNERIALPGFASGVELYIDVVRQLILE